MTGFTIIGLIVAAALLWRQIEALRERVEALELAAGEPAFAPEPARVPVHKPVPVPMPMPMPMPMPLVFEPALPVHSPEPAFFDSVGASKTKPDQLYSPARAGFEDLFGRKLPIWAGGVTLAVAGVLIVRHSIDAGLLSPAVRVVFGLVFGVGLIVGANAARRRAAIVRDPRVAQALSGAGIATLYASILVAANLYALVGPATAFVGLAAVTALAGGLALRFGAPSAVLGLVGGLAAPALVGSGPPDVPLLSAYLALAVGGLCSLSRRQGWTGLGVAALAGGFGWGAVLLLGGALNVAEALSVGAYTMLLGIGLPLLLVRGERGTVIRLGGALAGCAQMAALVATGGFAPLNWGLFALLSIAGVWLARREPALRPVAPAGLATALLLMAAWPAANAVLLGAVIAGTVVIFGGPAAWDVWRANGRVDEAGRIAAVAVAIPVLPLLQLAPGTPITALLAGMGAVLAGGVAALGWTVPARHTDARFGILVATAAGLTAWVAVALAPAWADVPCVAAIAAALLALGRRAEDALVEASAWILGGATLSGLVLQGIADGDVARALGVADVAAVPLRMLSWGVPALAAALFSRHGQMPRAAWLAPSAGVLLVYVAAAQAVPAAGLPVVAALLLAACLIRREGAARGAALLPVLGWAAWPLGQWLCGAGLALTGTPLQADALPTVADTLLRLALPALVLPLALRCENAWHRPALIAASALGGIVAHTLYKQLFAIGSPDAFVTFGMAERTIWEALLALAALVVHHRAPRAAQMLGAASLLHFAWFTVGLHDPLWTAQTVGAWPIANLVTAAYGTGLLLLAAAARVPLASGVARLRHWAVMATIILFAASTLRQLAHGTVLHGAAVGDAENIGWSLLGIGLAIGFLRHGIAMADRDWRIASLLLMLAAVAKVFLADAAGLDGLFRIAAFAGLGFSLIGIGWLYSRHLPAR